MTNDDLLLLQTCIHRITTDVSPASLHGRRHLSKMRSFFLCGETITGIGIVLEECTHCKEDFLGQCQSDQNVSWRYFRGSLCNQFHTRTAGNEYFFASTCRVLFLRSPQILTVCPSACTFHNRLIRNLLTLVS